MYSGSMMLAGSLFVLYGQSSLSFPALQFLILSTFQRDFPMIDAFWLVSESQGNQYAIDDTCFIKKTPFSRLWRLKCPTHEAGIERQAIAETAWSSTFSPLVDNEHCARLHIVS